MERPILCLRADAGPCRKSGVRVAATGFAGTMAGNTVPDPSMPMRALLMLLCLACASGALADSAPMPTGPGQRIVAAFERKDAAALNAMLDVDALLERVVGSMELPAASRAGFEAGFRKSAANSGANLISGMEASNGVPKLVRSRKAGNGTLQLIRLTLSDDEGSLAGYNYIEFETSADGRIIDWRSHATCARASDTMRLLVASMFEGESLMATLFGASTDREAVDAMTEFSEALGKQQWAKAHELLDELPEEFRASMAWAGMRASIASMYDEDAYRRDLAFIAEKHGRHPDVQFMLIDHFFYAKDYERMLQAVQGFERGVVTDAGTRQLECTSYVLLERWPDAERACVAGTELEPDFEPIWWTLVEVHAHDQDATKLMAALDEVEQRFGKQMDPDALVKLEGYEWLASDPAFEPWAKARR